MHQEPIMMARTNLAERLQHSIVRYSALGIILISVIVAAVSTIPLYYNLRQDQEQDLELLVRSRAIAVEEYLAHARNVAAQITSRTQIRAALETYNQGAMSLDELQAFSTPKLEDALHISPEVAAIVRFDEQNQPVVQVGIPIPPEHYALSGSSMEITIHDPILIHAIPYLVVRAPIRNSMDYVGADMVLFDLTRLKQIIHDPVGMGTTGTVLLGRDAGGPIALISAICTQRENLPTQFPPNSSIGQAFHHALNQETGFFAIGDNPDTAQIVAYGPVQESNWAIVVTINTEELYGLVNRQIFTLLILIGILLGLGIFGTLRLVRPLTGKLVLHTDELQREIQVTTTTLHTELNERLRIEATLRTVNRALATLSECNQALVRATDETALLQHTCQILVEIGGYRMAWVGFAMQDAAKTILPVAHAGYEEGYLAAVPVTWDDTRQGQHPISMSIGTGTPWITQDILSDPQVAPWREQATQRGYAAMIVLPLGTDPQPIGVLTIYAATRDVFDQEAIKLLLELASDLTYGLTTLRTRTERQRALEALEQLRQHSDLILKAVGEGIYGVDTGGNITFINPAALRMIGYTEEEVIGKSHQILLHPAYHNGTPYNYENNQDYPVNHNDIFHRTDEEMFWRKDGTPFPVEYISTPMFEENNLVGVVVTFQDISARKRAEAQLRHQALHDPLTGLPNRAQFLELLAHTLNYAQRRGIHPFAILFLDLDNFKVINDSLGHMDGDELLIIIAHRIAACLRNSDTIARFGGDEFALLLHNIRDWRDAATVAEKIQQSLTQPIQLNGHEVTTTASIGITLSSNSYEQPSDLLRDADTALHQAKARGRNRYEMFDATMRDQVLAQLHIAAALRRAIERQELCLYYQPIVTLDTGTIVGFEALLRWQHPQRGLLPPSEFIHIAEETGLMVAIGEWVVAAACQQLHCWQQQFPNLHPLTVSVNLSGDELMRGDIIERIRHTLATTGLAPNSLKLEITESVMMDHAETTIATLKHLRDLGIQLCIDDFGTGYSSLRYLHRFPIKILKIDRSFISTLNVATESAVITQSIVMLSHTLGLEVVAEGIETLEQLASLRELHCEYGQGFLFARPLDSTAVEALLHTTATHQPPYQLLPTPT